MEHTEGVVQQLFDLSKFEKWHIFQEDKNMIWTPWINSNNIESTDKEKRANDVEVMKVVPNSNFKFMHNSKTNYQNALLFKVDIKIRYLLIFFKNCNI